MEGYFWKTKKAVSMGAESKADAGDNIWLDSSSD